MAKKEIDNYKKIAQNKKARRNYAVVETYEAGIILLGSEVKSLRSGSCSIDESYIVFKDGSLTLVASYIGEYKHASFFSHNETRPRLLLLNKKEIKKVTTGLDKKGLTCVPLDIYFNHRGLVKLTIALAQGKKLHDKREDIKKRDWNINKQRMLKNFNR